MSFWMTAFSIIQLVFGGILLLFLVYGVPAYILYRIIKHAVKRGTEEANRKRDDNDNYTN